MTIEREGIGFIVECDKCSNYFNVDSEFFQDAVDELKREGWKIRKDENDEWIHICPRHGGGIR